MNLSILSITQQSQNFHLPRLLDSKSLTCQPIYQHVWLFIYSPMCLLVYGFTKAPTIILSWVREFIREKSGKTATQEVYLLEESNEIWGLSEIWKPHLFLSVFAYLCFSCYI